MATPHIKIHKALGQKALSTIKRLGLLSDRHKILRNGEHLLIPLSKEPEWYELEELKEIADSLEMIWITGVEKVRRPKNLVEALGDRLPPHLLSTLPRSYDLIGDIAIIEIPRELKPYKREIGEALLKIHPNIRLVLAKASAIEGIYRVREYEVLVGEGSTETIHREFGINLSLDITKVYFSPRLAYERQRVASLVRDGEVVVDMFAGVGPFSIHIAKRLNRVLVYAIDINPDAYRYLLKNIELNKVRDRVKPILGDCREVIDQLLVERANRVIMNFPEKAEEFLPWACRALKKEGGVIHFYCFSQEPYAIEKALEKAANGVERSGRVIKEVLSKRKVRATAPYEWQIGLDLLVA